MKPLSASEMQNLALELKTLEGCRLQEVKLSQDLLALGLYGESLFWLVFDLSNFAPQVLYFDGPLLPRFKEDKKPIVLFLKANLLGARLVDVEAPPDLGRVLRLYFQNDRHMEFRLYPRGANVLVSAGGKSLSLHKPQPLKELASVDSPLDELGEVKGYPLALIKQKTEQWLNEKSTLKKDISILVSGSKEPAQRQADDTEKRRAKLLKAMANVEKDMALKREEKWLEAGEWLKTNQSLTVPLEYEAYIDRALKLSVNIENCFAKAKEVQRKIAGAQERLRSLQNQIQSLDGHRNTDREYAVAQHDKRPAPLLHEAEAKGRTHELAPNVYLFIGKSAEDNLRILRKAKSWYYWIHLRDEPSAHGVITRNKNQALSQGLLHEAAQLLLENHFGLRRHQHIGEKYTVLLAECRFVRPIKGDRLGRVTYSDESSFVHQFKNS